MDDIPAHALLREALTLFNDRPNFGLRNAPEVTSYRIAGRIDAYFARRGPVSDDSLQRARRLLGAPTWLRFDTPSIPDAANWLPAWILVTSVAPDGYRLAALEAAVAALPPMTREVFLAHRDRSLDYPAIAAELGIDVAEVEHRLATALLRLDDSVTAAERALGNDAGAGESDAGRF